MPSIRLPGGEWVYDEAQPLGPPGGFGSVFAGRAQDGVEVAIKRLHLTARELAHREMQIAQELRSRQLAWVIPVLDAGQDSESDGYFVVMPKAERSLQDALAQRGTVVEREAVQILQALSRGLAEVGDIVHRDLKPGNVLFHEERWKITDFGIARFVEESTSLQTLKDFLSAPYAAPEQWLGERATKATDVYALGCIAHTLLRGEPPFPGPTREQFRDQHLNQPPPELGGTSAGLRSLVSIMLRKAPTARPSLERVIEQFDRLASEGSPGPGARAGASALAAAGASVAEEEARREAAADTEERRLAARRATAAEGVAILRGVLRHLWHRIKAETPAAREDSDRRIVLGRGALSWDMTHEFIPEGGFEHSKWDVIVGAALSVTQQGGRHGYPGRSTSLWYARRPGDVGYRWLEVPYMVVLQAGPAEEPFALKDVSDADLAASTIMHRYQHAAEPAPVDDEDFDPFCDRWMARLAQAAQGALEHPSRLPE